MQAGFHFFTVSYFSLLHTAAARRSDMIHLVFSNLESNASQLVS